MHLTGKVMVQAFQSTKPQRLRLVNKIHLFYNVYFNPRSRKGFDIYNKMDAPYPNISIHEAAKASTAFPETITVDNEISIHEAAKASTVTAVVAFPSCSYFNPRSRKGFDNHTTFSKAKRVGISIHEAAKASTQGA